ncbi:MAG: prepilin-type N-terminal cleavage/methylation domain-containing protein [Rickettsiales bacterium]|nr:prepilin-type N-terminal cleavage/methylation domain-containing protein [Rickettsiales bacterium]
MRKAFTLLELAITVGVMSILITMAMVSREFVVNARIKKLIFEINEMEVSIKSFYNLYNGLPGDLKNASTFFDAAIDGDGDDKVEYQDEVYNAMLQMQNANLINGSFSATELDYAYRSNFISGAVIRLVFTEELDGFFVPNTNVIQIGQANDGDNAIFTPEQAEIFDGKFDDSKPNSGRVTYRIFGTTTAESCTNNTQSYYVANAEIGCNLVFKLDFL